MLRRNGRVIGRKQVGYGGSERETLFCLVINEQKVGQLSFEVQAKLYKNILFIISDRLRERLESV